MNADEQARKLRDALARRWQKRLDMLRAEPEAERLDQLDVLIAEDEDRDRHRRDRARLDVANEGGVLVRPRAGRATPAMRGRRDRTPTDNPTTRRRYRTDWPEESE